LYSKEHLLKVLIINEKAEAILKAATDRKSIECDILAVRPSGKHILTYFIGFKVIKGPFKDKIIWCEVQPKNPILVELGINEKGWQEYIFSGGNPVHPNLKFEIAIHGNLTNEKPSPGYGMRFADILSSWKILTSNNPIE